MGNNGGVGGVWYVVRVYTYPTPDEPHKPNPTTTYTYQQHPTNHHRHPTTNHHTTRAERSQAAGGNLIAQVYPRYGSGAQFLRKVRLFCWFVFGWDWVGVVV